MFLAGFILFRALLIFLLLITSYLFVHGFWRYFLKFCLILFKAEQALGDMDLQEKEEKKSLKKF